MLQGYMINELQPRMSSIRPGTYPRTLNSRCIGSTHESIHIWDYLSNRCIDDIPHDAQLHRAGHSAASGISLTFYSSTLV